MFRVLMAIVAKNKKWFLLPNCVFTNLFFSYDTPPRLPRKAGSVIRRRLRIIETFKGEPLEWFIHNPLKVDYYSRVGFGHKGQRVPVFLDSPGTADTVDIVVGTSRHVVVDDVGNP
jgi:hypothetical protein